MLPATDVRGLADFVGGKELNTGFPLNDVRFISPSFFAQNAFVQSNPCGMET
jgi:hypothetical protein